MMSFVCSSCGRLKNKMCTSAKKCLSSSPVFKPRVRLGQKTQTRTKKMHFWPRYIITIGPGPPAPPPPPCYALATKTNFKNMTMFFLFTLHDKQFSTNLMFRNLNLRFVGVKKNIKMEVLMFRLANT
jgi:hypothetical protein